MSRIQRYLVKYDDDGVGFYTELEICRTLIMLIIDSLLGDLRFCPY